MNGAIEKWKDVKHFGMEKFYRISTFGRVFSKSRVIERNGKPAVLKGRMLKIRVPKRNKYYATVGLCRNGVVHSMYLHRLIAETFIPNPKNKPEVNHKDGNRRNNHVSNLEWITHRGNARHAARLGLWAKQKLTHDQVRVIKKRLKQGEVQKVIAKEYGVSENCITFIKQGKYFGYIKI